MEQRQVRDADIFLRARTDALCDEFNRELRKMDPYLELIFIGDDAGVQGAVPNRYHLSRRSPDAPATLISITDEHGGFVEPGSAIFDKLAEGDLWSARSRRERQNAQQEAERARDRKRARETEQRQEELKDRYNAAFRTSVSMADTGWSQNASGRRGRRAA
jgi:hypothetical protein